MNKKLRIAVLGATGLLGQKLVDLLGESKLPWQKIRLFATFDNVGEDLPCHEELLSVEDIAEIDFADFDLVFLALPSDVAKIYAPKALEHGCLVIDSSCAYLEDERCPVVIPALNSEHLLWHEGLVVSAQSLALALAPLLSVLSENYGLERVFYTALQSASAFGRDAIYEFEKQYRDVLNFRDPEIKIFPKRLAFNLIPQNSPFVASEETAYEKALPLELKRILPESTWELHGSCVLTPLYFGQGISLQLQTKKAVSAKEVRALLFQVEDLHVLDNPHEEIYPTPMDSLEASEILVGRIRVEQSSENLLNLWLASDNVYTVAKNMVQIALELVSKNLFLPKKRLSCLE